MQTCEAYEKCPAELTASSAFENTPKRSETNSETCPRMRAAFTFGASNIHWRTPFPDVCRREGRKTKRKPLRLRGRNSQERQDLASADRTIASAVGKNTQHRKKKLENFTLSWGEVPQCGPPQHYVNERVCSGSLLALCTCRILPSNSPSHGRHKVDREAVQAREQVHVRVHAAWRESAKGTREMQQVIALAKVAAPSLERNDRVGVLVEDFL